MLQIFKKRYWIFVIAILFLAGAAIVAYGFVPVMKIGNKTIVFAEYLKTYSAIKSYDKISQRSAAPAAEITRQALEVLVENRFFGHSCGAHEHGLKKGSRKIGGRSD